LTILRVSVLVYALELHHDKVRKGGFQVNWITYTQSQSKGC